MTAMTAKIWAEQLIPQLPKEPREGMLRWAQETEPVLNQKFMIYHRESVPKESITETSLFMIYDDEGKNVWGSVGTCTACQDTNIFGWHDGDLLMFVGDDGNSYPGVPDYESYEACQYEEGRKCMCPSCGEEVTVIRKKSLNRGRTYATQVMSLERVGDTAVIIYWLIRRHINSSGRDWTEVWPRDAIAIREDRTLVRLTATQKTMYAELPDVTGWHVARKTDPEDVAFYCWGNGFGQSSRNSIGAWAWPNVPDLTGSSGEKSGIADWFRNQRDKPFKYLKAEKQYPSMENLCRAGWTGLLEHLVAHNLPLDSAINTAEVKPHLMLGLPKEFFREIKNAWSAEETILWKKLHEKGTDVDEFLELLKAYGVNDLQVLVNITEPTMQLHRYLQKQRDIQQRDRITYYKDYRAVLAKLTDAPTIEERYPPHLREAHDRLQKLLETEKEAILAKEFEKTLTRLKPLEWTDGNLCIIIPQTNHDLYLEGKTLNHCVGRYGPEHVAGKPIFFVRHYRRPERSYYTLNVNLLGKNPARIQLHGYGNEFHAGKNGKKGGHHNIPKEVTDFCERWEREVLAPWYKKEKGRITT